MPFRPFWALVCALAAALAPLAAAQSPPNETDDDTLGWEDRVVDDESTIEGTPGIVYYVVVAAMSLAVFGVLLFLSVGYLRRRGSGRPPPK